MQMGIIPTNQEDKDTEEVLDGNQEVAWEDALSSGQGNTCLQLCSAFVDDLPSSSHSFWLT